MSESVSSQARLLVVDDEEMNRDMLSRRLSRRGYSVTTAAEGAEALALLEAEPFNLVILDLMMPGLSGFEVVAAMRARPHLAALPVIIASARGDTEAVVQALGAGAQDYVVKPIELPILVARIEGQLRAVAQRDAAPTPEQLAPGVTLAGKYRLGPVVGEGSFGTVFRAEHLGLGTEVAVKVLHPDLVGRRDVVDRFRREGMLTCRVQHPNAVQILDSDVSPGGLPFLVMELLEGPTAHERLQEWGRLPLDEAARILIPVCRALEAAHAQGVIHRDVKPDNIILSVGANGAEVVKVLDFGIARLMTAKAGESATVEGRVMGTPGYMAPERLRGQDFGAAADMYSVGVLAYELLSGRRPYRDTADALAMAVAQVTTDPVPLHDRARDLPSGLSALVAEAMAREPSERPTPAGFASRLGTLVRLLSRSEDLPALAEPHSDDLTLEFLAAETPVENSDLPQSPDTRPAVDMGALFETGVSLTSEQAFVLSCFDGTLTLAEAQDLQLPLDADEILQMLHLAWRVGVVKVG